VDSRISDDAFQTNRGLTTIGAASYLQVAIQTRLLEFINSTRIFCFANTGEMNVKQIRVTNRFGYWVDFAERRSFRALDETVVRAFIIASTGSAFSRDSSDESAKLESEGSFSRLWIRGEVCARFTSEAESISFLKRVVDSLDLVTGEGFTEYIHSYGILVDSNGRRLGLLVLMSVLDPITPNFDDEESLFSSVSRISRIGFHNDLKIDNIMLDHQGTKVCVIDFDLLSPTTLTIALSGTSFIELDLSSFMETLTTDSDSFIKLFRLFYDYTCLSLSVNQKHGLYRPVLSRLVSVFHQLESQQYLSRLMSFLGEERVRDIPIEVLIRCPEGVEGVSVNLFDLKGNAFAHGLPDWDDYPSIFRSTGVYWPNR